MQYHICPYAFFHRKYILSRFDSDTCSEFLLMAIYSMAARFSTDPVILSWKVADAIWTTGEPFFFAARPLAAKVLDAAPTIDIVHALLVLGCYAFQSGRSTTGWQYWSIMTCLAEELQLDVDSDTHFPHLSWFERETRRRTWWFIFELDREISSFVRRPTFIRQLPQLNAPAPEHVWAALRTDELAARDLPPRLQASVVHHDYVDALLAKVRLMHIFEQVYEAHGGLQADVCAVAVACGSPPDWGDTLHGVAAVTAALASLATRVDALEADIDALLADLPSWFREPPRPGVHYSPGLVCSRDNPTWTVVQFHLLVQVVRVSLSLPLAVGAVVDLLAAQQQQQQHDGNKGHGTDLVHPYSRTQLRDLARFCAAASEMVRLFRDVVEPTNPAFHHLHMLNACGTFAAAAGVALLTRVQVDPHTLGDDALHQQQGLQQHTTSLSPLAAPPATWSDGLAVLDRALAAFARGGVPALRMRAALAGARSAAAAAAAAASTSSTSLSSGDSDYSPPPADAASAVKACRDAYAQLSAAYPTPPPRPLPPHTPDSVSTSAVPSLASAPSPIGPAPPPLPLPLILPGDDADLRAWLANGGLPHDPADAAVAAMLAAPAPQPAQLMLAPSLAPPPADLNSLLGDCLLDEFLLEQSLRAETAAATAGASVAAAAAVAAGANGTAAVVPTPYSMRAVASGSGTADVARLLAAARGADLWGPHGFIGAVAATVAVPPLLPPPQLAAAQMYFAGTQPAAAAAAAAPFAAPWGR
ncbi:hypothetical protein HK405_004317, partial [Cladochytrium tenue]